MVYVETAQNDKSVTCSCVPNFFYFAFLTKVTREERLNLWKKIFYSAFSRLGPFPQVFTQFKECLGLQLHEIVRVVHEVVCPIVFNLIDDRYWQGVVLKLMKSCHIFSIFSGFSLFLKFLGRLMIDLY